MCLFLGAFAAIEAHHVAMTHGFHMSGLTIVASTTPRWIFLAATMPFVLQLAVRVPLTPVRGRVVAMHVVVLVAISAVHAWLDTWATGLETPQVAVLFGMIPRLARSWLNTTPVVVTTYAAVLFAAWGMTEARDRQRRALRESQLESQLQSARLAALRAQLQPHFLYNTLNGIAALVSDVQPARAVAAIEQLGELLHASLRDDGREEITVGEEVALAERYLALQRMRFGERLQYERHVAPDIADCLVPVLLLQPIIENAVVHGLDAGQAALHVRIDAKGTPQGVEITVENDGPELRAESSRVNGHGVGLSTTRARLTTVHGDLASLTLRPRDKGGVIVRIVIPRRVAAPGRSVPVATLEPL